jgi:hypothetical protein
LFSSLAEGKGVVLFEIAFQMMGFQASIKNVFLENSQAILQLLFLFFSQLFEIFRPLLFKGCVIT